MGDTRFYHPTAGKYIYLMAYTINEVLALATERGLNPPEWKWKPLKTYNGFTHEQRVVGWQAMHLAIRMKLIEPASAYACEICRATPPVTLQYHSEDYCNLAEHVLCQHCHKLLHQRHRYPEKWCKLVTRYAKGDEWYASLAMTGFNE